MSEYNRQLSRLMDEVTRGDVWCLADLVEEYGRPLVTRVLSDGFGVVLDLNGWSNEEIRAAIADCRFLPLDETLALVEQSDISYDVRGHSAPGALDFQRDWKVLRPYASDDQEAIAEVRRLHAERREPAERQQREAAKWMPGPA